MEVNLSTWNWQPTANKNRSPLHAHALAKATINVMSSRKMGKLCEKRVGYDRFSGELAYRQLTELYRALRVYVNGFQPSMKLQTKQRDGSKVHRTYDQA